jgi:hypothetical protein
MTSQRPKYHFLNTRTVYNWCAFCGSEENIEHLNQYQAPIHVGYFDFCKDTECYEKYSAFKFSEYTNLSDGIPFVYGKLFPEKRRAVTKPELDANGEPMDLVCAFCGVRSPDVITNTSLIDSEHADFCKNSKCCRRYVAFLTKVKRIPHALGKLLSPVELSAIRELLFEN